MVPEVFQGTGTVLTHSNDLCSCHWFQISRVSELARVAGLNAHDFDSQPSPDAVAGDPPSGQPVLQGSLPAITGDNVMLRRDQRNLGFLQHHPASNADGAPVRGRRRDSFCSDRCRMRQRRLAGADRRRELFAKLQDDLRDVCREMGWRVRRNAAMGCCRLGELHDVRTRTHRPQVGTSLYRTLPAVPLMSRPSGNSPSRWRVESWR
jgi:hypothetical protein